MNEKTPVTILQELCVANSSQPVFNLIHDGTGTMKPIFKYEVSVTIQEHNVKAVGTGRSKKEAKHDSARIALEQLSELNICHEKPSKVSEVESLPRFVISDAIRTLFELCDERKLPMPEYELIQDIGPPHARQFTMMCSVASLKQSAVATTKKAAKQLSASNMIDLLRTVENDEITGKEIVSISQADINKILEQKTEKIILTKRFKEYDSPFTNYDQEKCKDAVSVLDNDSFCPGEKMKGALNILNIEFEITEIPTTQNSILHLLSLTRIEPEFYLSEFSLEELYKKANNYLRVFLS